MTTKPNEAEENHLSLCDYTQLAYNHIRKALAIDDIIARETKRGHLLQASLLLETAMEMYDNEETVDNPDRARIFRRSPRAKV